MYMTKAQLAKMRKRQAHYAHLVRIHNGICMLLTAALFVGILCLGCVLA